MWRPIIVGVENTGEAARAAVVAEEIASRAGTVCHPVHATRDVWSAVRAASRHAIEPARSAMAELSELPRTLIQTATTSLRQMLGDRVRRGTAERLRVEIGRPAEVLGRVASELDAELIVVGTKSHSSVGRWLGACAAERMMREVPVPILIASPHGRTFNRVLVAVDFSEMARPTIAWAERLAGLFGSAIRVMHVVEILPEQREVSVGMTQERFRELSSEIMEESIRPYVTMANADLVTRQGHVSEVVSREIEEWGADLLVIGSHGKRLAESMVLGSTAERFLQKPPTAMLIVPGQIEDSSVAGLAEASHGYADDG